MNYLFITLDRFLMSHIRNNFADQPHAYICICICTCKCMYEKTKYKVAHEKFYVVTKRKIHFLKFNNLVALEPFLLLNQWSKSLCFTLKFVYLGFKMWISTWTTSIFTKRRGVRFLDDNIENFLCYMERYVCMSVIYRQRIKCEEFLLVFTYVAQSLTHISFLKKCLKLSLWDIMRCV